MITLEFTTTHFNAHTEELVLESYTLEETVRIIEAQDASVMFDPENYLWADMSAAYYMCVTLSNGHRYPLPLVFKAEHDRDIAELEHQQQMLDWYRSGGMAASDYFSFLGRTAGGVPHQELNYIKAMILDELRDRQVVKLWRTLSRGMHV